MNKAKVKHNKKAVNIIKNRLFYQSNKEEINNKKFIVSESIRIKTKKNEKVFKVFKEKRFITDWKNVFRIINKIYEKNKEYAFSEKNNENIKNTHLVNIVASIPLLMLSYEKLIKHKRALNFVSFKSDAMYINLDRYQKDSINATNKNVQNINLDTLREVSRLIKAGKYSWGASKRTFINKLGERLIIIPFFMDKVVQYAIKYVLVAIYEPYFDKMNCSFGFRPNRSIHDAIYSLTNSKNQSLGLDKVLGGCLKAKYNNFNRKSLIQILERKIIDRRFLNLIKGILNYELNFSKKYLFAKGSGYVDILFFWNIYLLEFDNFVTKNINKIVGEINIKAKYLCFRDKKILNIQKINYCNIKYALNKLKAWMYKNRKQFGLFKFKLIKLQEIPIKDWSMYDLFFYDKLKRLRQILKDCSNFGGNNQEIIINNISIKIKMIFSKVNKFFLFYKNKKRPIILYCRYKNDWIILTNIERFFFSELKSKIILFLKEELYITIVEEEIVQRKKVLHFLGFKLETGLINKLKISLQYSFGNLKKKRNLIRQKIFAFVDKQALINTLYLKGYCQKNGIPKEITNLNNLEAFTIIDKINRVLLELVNYYVNTLKTSKMEFSRLVYILRYSCLKTLALKHKSTIKKIFVKYKSEKYNKKESRTIIDTIVIDLQGEKFIKQWKLLTFQSLLKECRKKNRQKEKKEIINRSWRLYKGKLLDFTENVYNYIFLCNLDFITSSILLNIKPSSNFDLTCFICGAEESIELHNVKYVRKVQSSKTNKQKNKLCSQIIRIKDKRRLPVCRLCCINIFYKEKKDTNYKNFLIENGWVSIARKNDKKNNEVGYFNEKFIINY